ncbi:hypothetical protein GALMADRAFT_59260 [Galerina marginata CBS 339.88]|uniref:Mitochondrial carrier protein n=1 Tax=Galerina marginata (strain CBS 339.88) TaxID=685588 RepID=A0A067TGM9_GALM3|nr:hypothetical protein GALMADRAFT_59260 [Galerina marginata CBS 339.88]
MAGPTSQDGSIQAAIARTASRSMALYFARPVRLFRPAKVNGWQTLKNLASQQGTTLTHQYILTLVKSQGVWVIPKHFVPPMIVNAALGTILWGSYAEASRRLEPLLGSHTLSKAAISGAIAGACQAVAAAPAENVRILLEHGLGGHSWSCAWKEVFRKKSVLSPSENVSRRIQDVRNLRGWLHEVGGMAGRCWSGWRWGCGKDTVGFAAFFLIFELSRRTGLVMKTLTSHLLSPFFIGARENSRFQKQLPAIANGVVLVAGGVLAGLTYELLGRPWDIARRTIHLERLVRTGAKQSSYQILRRSVAELGFLSLFKHSNLLVESTKTQTRWNKALRTAGRVGPWGVGFLVWEAYSSGLS